jgi:hypothetical protein
MMNATTDLFRMVIAAIGMSNRRTKPSTPEKFLTLFCLFACAVTVVVSVSSVVSQLWFSNRGEVEWWTINLPSYCFGSAVVSGLFLAMKF